MMAILARLRTSCKGDNFTQLGAHIIKTSETPIVIVVTV